MAKDDYNVIAYKILLYFYGVLKRKIVYSDETFNKLIDRSDISEQYFVDIIRMMINDGLITGAIFTKAWGNEYILSSELCELQITTNGIQYLQENSTMNKIMNALKDTPGLASSLINIVKPF